MNPKTLISLAGGVISNPLRRLAAPATFELREGESIAVVGANGSGKSTLLEMLRGGFFLREGTLQFDLDDESYRSIKLVKFDNAYSTSETQYYYQQRWQAFERDAAPKAGELLAGAQAFAPGAQTADSQHVIENACIQNEYKHNIQVTDYKSDSLQAGNTGNWLDQLFDLLNIWPLLDKEIITLSSGELRRFSIARSLLERPQVLMLESPFIGLDPPTRQTLCDLMELLSARLGISFIMTLTSPDQIPPVVTHVYFMDEGRLSKRYTSAEARRLGQNGTKQGPAPKSEGVDRLSGNHLVQAETPAPGREEAKGIILPTLRDAQRYDKVVEMRSVNISFGERQLFKDLNWTVHSGQKWNVTGANGSGKSTLLSLVNADNPRAYSLDITLFDHRRGTGESIWDIKRHIGFLSSEMHSSFITSDTVLEIIREGLADGYRGCEPDNRLSGEDDYLMRWLKLFGAEHLALRRYNTLSSGEQRYILLIRAFVKDPDLLILDEPFQGLDPERRHRAGAVIESFCAQANKTLIFVTHYIEEIPGIVTHTLRL